MISIRLDGELSKWHTAWLAAHLRHCATHAAALCDLVDRIRSSPLEQSDTVISAPRRSAQLADTTRAAVVAVAAAAFTSVAALLGKPATPPRSVVQANGRESFRRIAVRHPPADASGRS